VAAIAAGAAAGQAEGLVLVPAGRFTMGDPFGEGNRWERPLHAVYVNAFYMDAGEVTKALWDSVQRWAVDRGYSFGAAPGKAPDHPVHSVSWYDCVKWCNARSEKEGLTPCYYTSAMRADVYRMGELDLSERHVAWTADGYRLPTEAEWEKAARGGAEGRRFAWSGSDTINHTRANYCSYWVGGRPFYPYDDNPAEGFHPAYAVGAPYTSPAGVFPANGYGLYDLCGNVLEWCWDWYESQWYGRPGAALSDPHGPAAGAGRVKRGGSWGAYAFFCRAAHREGAAPRYVNNVLGFRCVRSAGYRIRPEVRINGAEAPAALRRGAVLSVDIALSTTTAMDADWWLAAATPAGTFAWDAGSGEWSPVSDPAALRPAYQGPLFEIPAPYTVLRMNTAGLPEGRYEFFFGLDTVMDGALDFEPTLTYGAGAATLGP